MKTRFGLALPVAVAGADTELPANRQASSHWLTPMLAVDGHVTWRAIPDAARTRELEPRARGGTHARAIWLLRLDLGSRSDKREKRRF